MRNHYSTEDQLLEVRTPPGGGEADGGLRARALDLLPEGAFLTEVASAENRVVYANCAFARLTGRAVDELVGRPWCLPLGLTAPPEVRAAFLGKRAWSGELAVTRADGSPAWYQLSLTPVRDAAGRVTHFLGVQTDVTERKCLEDSARQEQKMTALGWLATGIVHDFNNLLTAILGHGDILLREPRIAGLERESVHQILRVAEWGTALTRQLLLHAREQAAEPRTLELRAVVTSTHSMLRRVIGANIALETVLAPDLGCVRADPAQLEQLLVHLAVHARDALPGGGRITLEASNVLVEASGGWGDIPPGPYVRLAAADTGWGLTNEVGAESFRALGATKERGKGTGLRLGTVRQIVEPSGGHVTVSSQPGRGTRIEVYLPRVEESVPSEAPQQRSARPSRRGSETILVVEAEIAVRDVICRTLRHEGYTILEAEGGDEARTVCEQHRGLIQLLLTDTDLPKTSARALVAHLTALNPGLKILCMSSYVQQPEGSFLSKPFTLDCLTRMVREVLDEGASS